MRVINTNVGSWRLTHLCPVCKTEVYNSGLRNKCPSCGTKLEFPNENEIMELIGYKIKESR